MQTKHLLPFLLTLGVTAGSTAVYAQTLDNTLPLGDSAATATTNSTATTCAEGDATCAEQSASTSTTLTPEGAETDAQSDMATDSDPALPVAPGAEAEGSTGVAADTDPLLAPADTDTADDATMPVAPSTDMATDETLDDQQTLVEVAAVPDTDALIGARAYDANAEWIGEVSAVIPADTEGNEERFVVDVGGFLGIGEKPVAIAADDLRVAVDAEGDVDHVVLTQSAAELEAMPEVEM